MVRDVGPRDAGAVHDIDALVREVLRDGFEVNLGTVDADGPWVAPLVYVFDSALNVYWISTADSRHSRAIASDPRVAAVVVACHDTDNERALQISGSAARIEGAIFELEQRLMAKRGMSIPRSPGEILAGGFDWYRLTPDRFELTWNTAFGYDRQTYQPGR